MSNTAPTSDIHVEIVSAPAMKDMTITPVGQNMFSLNLNIITVVRFPSNTQSDQVSVEHNTQSSEQLRYADATAPEPGGETAAFNDFSKQHGYPPQTRAILAEWVELQKGSA